MIGEPKKNVVVMGHALDPELPWKYQGAWQSSKISVEKGPTQVSEQSWGWNPSSTSQYGFEDGEGK